MKGIRRLVGLAVAFAAVVGGMVLLAPAAAAVPAPLPGCGATPHNLGKNGGYVTASCSDRYARAIAMCVENDGNRYEAYGPWASPGATSRANCHEYAALYWYNAEWSDAAPAQAEGARPAAHAGGVDTVTSDVTMLSMTCRVVKDFSPWTYVSGSCKRSALVPKEFYTAWLTCWDVSIGFSYPRYGDQFLAPWGYYGSTSTARCDAGDYAIDGGVS